MDFTLLDEILPGFDPYTQTNYTLHYINNRNEQGSILSFATTHYMLVTAMSGTCVCLVGATHASQFAHHPYDIVVVVLGRRYTHCQSSAAVLPWLRRE